MEIQRTRNLFLRAIAAVYLSAFCSLYLQIRGLYGTDGILPAHTQINLKDKRNFWDKFLEKPTVLHLAPVFGLNVSLLMELVALVGITASFLGVISQKMCNTLNFFMLWISYLSLYQVGQTFMHFQWDIMLLETGLITVLVAPLFQTGGKSATPKDRLSFWLVRWLFFRLMFASGVVKLTSKCPTWWGLTALTVHYESQCIPTALAWYMHQLPVWFQKLSVVATFIIEILLPFLFFAPFRQLRLFANYSQILLQLLIIATGNYNFFNLLTLSLCFSLFDDYHLFSSSKRRAESSSVFEKMATISVIALLIISLNIWFGVELGSGEDVIRSKINFSIQDFDEFLKTAVPASVVMGTSSFVYTSISCLYSLVFRSKKSFLQFTASSIQFVAYFFMTAVLFGISLVPYTTLDRATQSSLPPVLVNWYGDYQGFNVAGSYGLFRSMTGVGGRPELILEGAAQLEGPWVEIPFKYKPGALDRPCPFIVPHQPRLDWQMWFAALSNYHQNPWLTSLAFRLLTNKTDVIKLLDTNIYNEFETDWPPKYVRGSLYTYHYTSFDTKEKENWWKRSRVDDYLPIFSADHAPLLEYLAKLKIIRYSDIPVKNAGLAAILDSIWSYFTSIEPHLVIWGLLTAALVIVRIK